MRGDGLELYDDKTPYEAEVYMQVPIDWITAENWAWFEEVVKVNIEITNISRANCFTNATAAVDLDNPANDDNTAVFTINIKIDSVKQRTSDVRSDLWYRYQTVTMFNPLNVLKPVNNVIYYFGAAWETRMTEVPNAVPSRDEEGNYQYIWYGNSEDLQWDWQNSDIVLYNKYANRLIMDGATDYEVVPGDTLTRISRTQYGAGNGYYFPLIMLASNDVVQDPDLIEPGMRLSIPDLQRNLDDSGARQAMKDFFAEIAEVYEQKSASEERTVLRNLAVQTRQGLLDLVAQL